MVHIFDVHCLGCLGPIEIRETNVSALYEIYVDGNLAAYSAIKPGDLPGTLVAETLEEVFEGQEVEFRVSETHEVFRFAAIGEGSNVVIFRWKPDGKPACDCCTMDEILADLPHYGYGVLLDGQPVRDGLSEAEAEGAWKLALASFPNLEELTV